MGGSREPFIGSEALTRGALNRHQLRTRYRAVFSNVHLPKQIQPSFDQRIMAAWLWSRRQGIIAGAAAAALHSAKWIDDDVPVELIYANSRAPHGILTRRDALLANEAQIFTGRVVTTPERTAFDIGRRGSHRTAVAQLDARARSTGFEVDNVARIAAAGGAGADGLADSAGGGRGRSCRYRAPRSACPSERRFDCVPTVFAMR